MIKIHLHNLILVITDTCPRDLADAAIRALDRRGPVYVDLNDDYSDIYPRKMPRFSPFIGQLGGKLR